MESPLTGLDGQESKDVYDVIQHLVGIQCTMVLEGGEVRTKVSYNTNGFPIPPHALAFLEMCFANSAQTAGDATATAFRTFKQAKKKHIDEEETSH